MDGEKMMMGPVEHVLRYFEYEHLPRGLQSISMPFYMLAHELADNPHLEGRELTVALRKLLESKDAAVRAALDALPREE